MLRFPRVLAPLAIACLVAAPDQPVTPAASRAIGAPAPAAAGPEQPSPKSYPIDLPTALRLADAANPQIQFARERINAAQAELERAEVLWLPNLSAGTTWARHDGQIQDVAGLVFGTGKSSLFVGGGAVANFQTAEAIYQPLVARQLVEARLAGERAATNDILLDVALGYWELVRAQGLLAVARENQGNARELDDLTHSYLKAQKIKDADAERARVELRLRTQEVEQARERGDVVSARLARLLRLDPFVRLEPAQAQVAAIELVHADAATAELAALALGARPELAESRALVALAQERLRSATYGPLLPSVLLGYRAGGFGGGRNDFFGHWGGRGDADALVYWELKNLGFGDRAIQRERQSEVRLAQIREIDRMDLVVSQVAEARAQVRSRREQMEIARLALSAAGRSFELNWKLFKEGGIELIRPIEVLQSIQALAKSRRDYLDTVIDYNRAQFQLYWALGNPVREAP